METFYIKIQALDYDDYPIGGDTKIGPFDSKDAAESWLENSADFYKRQWGPEIQHYTWQKNSMLGNHEVKIANVRDIYMTPPEDYETDEARAKRIAKQRRTRRTGTGGRKE